MKILYNLTSKRFAQRKFNLFKQKFEIKHPMLYNCYIIVQIDGLNFKKFTQDNNLLKPNDQLIINLMNSCSRNIFNELKAHLIYSYGFSDEFSFVFEPSTNLYDRNYQ